MKKTAFLVIALCGSLFGQTWGNIPTAGNIPSFSSGTCPSTPNLVASWDMSAGTGTSQPNNACLSSNTLTITPGTGGWTTQSGLSRGAYNFDGVATTGTHMAPANATNINFDFNQSFSVAFWVNFTSTSGPQEIIYKVDPANNFKGWEVSLGWSGSVYNVLLDVINNTSTSNWLEVFGAATLTTGTLHSVVITYDGTTHNATGTKFYIDGSVTSTVSNVNGLTTTTTNSIVPTIGMRTALTNPFKGKLGPIYIWNRVLTSTEVTSLNSNPYAVIN